MGSRKEKDSAPLGEALAKKGGLTLSQRANYDDLITDALVDRVYYWSVIRKNKPRYTGSRGLPQEEICDILRKTVVTDKQPGRAVAELLETMPALSKYYQKLGTVDEKEHFKRHLRKYVDIYMPDCPFEVTTTNRYTIDTHEASITARKWIPKGEVIKYLSGVQVAMTKEEERDLDVTRRDFSIVMSSRKKCPSLFLGPARFANHDCFANAKLMTRGTNGMQIMAARNIEAGEEITVTYGDDYFGEDNCECLCEGCEKLGRNGWEPYYEPREDDRSEPTESKAVSPEPEGKRDASTPYALRRKRKYVVEADDVSSRESSPGSGSGKRRKTDHESTTASTVVGLPLGSNSPNRVKRPSLLSRMIQQDPSPSPVTNAESEDATRAARRSSNSSRKDRRASVQKGPSSGSDTEVSAGSPFASSVNESDPSSQSTAASSIDGDLDAKTSTAIATDTSLANTPALSTPALGPLPSSKTRFPNLHEADSSSDLSDLSDSLELDDTTRTIRRKPRATRSRLRATSHLPTTPLPSIEHPSKPNLNPRRAGDYTMTETLLGTPNARWVRCRTCTSDFVQDDRQTRAECPRCERHSKIYGFVWPKCEREGKKDPDERVLDHRTVNRFIAPEEERGVHRGRRGLREEILKRETESRERSASVAGSPRRSGRRTLRLSYDS